MSRTAYQTQKGRRYKAVLYLDGAVVKTKRGFLIKKAARQWELTETRKRTMKTPTGTSFGFVANGYLDFMQERRQAQTFAYKRTVINHLLEFLGGDFIIEELPDSTIENYLVHLKQAASGKTANRHCKELSILWNWPIRRNFIQKNPWRVAEPFPEEKFIRQVPTLEDILKVREVATEEERDWIDALLHRPRIGEITNLKWDDIDFGLNTITLYARKRKRRNHEPRTLSLAPTFKDMLERRSQHRTADLVFPRRYGPPQPRSGCFLVGLFSRNSTRRKCPSSSHTVYATM